MSDPPDCAPGHATRGTVWSLFVINAPAVFTQFVQGAVSSTVTQAMTGGKINPASVITDGFGNVQADDVRSVFEGQGQQEQVLGQTQQQVMSATDVGAPGDALLFGPMGVAGETQPDGSSGNASVSGSYSSGSALFGPVGDMEEMTSAAAASSVSGVGGGSSLFLATKGSYTVQAGDSFASIASGILGDERYASLLMGANGVEPTYANIHGLQVGATLSLPDMGGLSDSQLSAMLTNGGQLISADQRITDARNAYELKVQARTAFASAAAITPPGSSLSADDIEFAGRILSQPGAGNAGDAVGYVSSTFTSLGLQDRASLTDVRGGFDAYGNNTANMPEFDLGTVLGQGTIGFAKGLVNGLPTAVVGLGNGIVQGAVIQGELEAGVDVRTALADGTHATAGWWNGQVFSYDNPLQQAGGFVGELAGPAGDLKALSLVRDGIVAADFGSTLERMTYALGTRTGTILSATESAPIVARDALATAESAGLAAESAGAGSDSVFVYRGTNRVAENSTYADTGHILSDAAQRSYMETGSLNDAYAASDATHQQWIDIWGSEDQYAQAHGAFGRTEASFRPG